VFLITVPPALQHLVDSLAKAERNLRPPPPEEPQNNLEYGKGEEHVGIVEKMADKEEDRSNRKDREEQAGDDGQQEQENRGPERNLGLRCREFTAPAMGARLGVARVHMQLGAELDVVAPPAKIAEQGFADSDAITVVTIFHGSETRHWCRSSFTRSHTDDQKPWVAMESNVENQKIFSVRLAVAARSDCIRRSESVTTSTRN